MCTIPKRLILKNGESSLQKENTKYRKMVLTGKWLLLTCQRVYSVIFLISILFVTNHLYILYSCM